MNNKQTKSVAAVQGVLEMLLKDAKAAAELVFYIGASIQAAQDHLAADKREKRLCPSSSATKSLLNIGQFQFPNSEPSVVTLARMRRYFHFPHQRIHFGDC